MRFSFTLIVFLLFLACKRQEKKNVIYGRIDNTGKSWIYLQKITEKGDETIDSVKASGDGSFEMKNPSTSPEFYLLRVNPTNVLFLILRPNETVEINGDAINLEHSSTIKGSRDSESLQVLRKFEKNLGDSINIVFEKAIAAEPEKRDSIGGILQEYYGNQMESFSKKFILENLNSIASLSATKFLDQYSNADVLTQLRDTLVKNMKGNRYVDEYDYLINQLSVLPPGAEAPEISLKTPEGKALSLSSLRGKVVLIDFWASWCAPCRKENPVLVKIYNEYKGKDFEIFGVSLDENPASWKNAIEKDRLTWPQVSELKRWESSVVKEYHFDAIPFNILIDRKGKILAKGIQPEELESTIARAIRN